MPTWHSLLNEIKARGSTFDVVRRERLKSLSEVTGRNVIIYYSGWLQKPKVPGTQVTDADKNGFMTVIHGLNRSKGLDLILQHAFTGGLPPFERRIFPLTVATDWSEDCLQSVSTISFKGRNDDSLHPS